MKTVLLALALFSQQGHELCPADGQSTRTAILPGLLLLENVLDGLS